MRTNDKIKGIVINGFEYKIIQLADDMTIFVNDLNSLEMSISEFLKFEKMSGLKLNLEKCEIIELGSMRLKQSDVPKQLAKLKINKGIFKTLGIWFAKDQGQCIELNYDVRLKNISSMLQIWRQRNLSWKGRIMIIKTLILSQVTHLFNMTYTPLKFLEQLDKLIYSFLWSDKPPRVKRETIIAKIEDGGLRMPDIFAFHSAQKIITMKNLIIEDDKCLNLFQSICGIGKLNHNLSEKEIEKKITNFNFHQQLLKCWFNFKSKSPESVQDILNEHIFFNRYVTINSNLIHPKDVGLNESDLKLKVMDLLNQNNYNRMICDLNWSQPN